MGRKRPVAGGLTERVKSARGRSNSSARWLNRQLNDPYVKLAREKGYRSRAAFKLLELDEKFKLLRPGLTVVDLGAAPGGWLQVASAAVGAKGRVVGIDLKAIDPLPDIICFEADFMDDAAPDMLKNALGGPVDLVLSDMAPNASGQPELDHLRIITLVEAACHFACEILKPGGTFVAKVWQGGANNELLTFIKQRFHSVKHAKPKSSRADSAETFLVAQGFRPVSSSSTAET